MFEREGEREREREREREKDDAYTKENKLQNEKKKKIT